MKHKHLIILCIIIAAAIVFAGIYISSTQTSSDSTASGQASVQLLGISYTGEYDDNGNFTVSNGDVSFVMTSSWENDEPVGNVSVTYGDGSVLEGIFKDGRLEGLVTKTENDGTFCTFRCYHGIPYGLVTEYNTTGELLSYDGYYQTYLISDLIEQSREFSASALNRMEQYSNSSVKITGTVYAVYDSADKEYAIVGTEDGSYILLCYSNNEYANVNQEIAPCLAEGDVVTAFCYYQTMYTFETSILRTPIPYSYLLNETSEEDDKTDEDESEEKSETVASQILSSDTNTFPLFTVFYLEKAGGAAMDRTSLDGSYEDVILNAYYYAGMECEVTGTVTQVVYDNSSVEENPVVDSAESPEKEAILCLQTESDEIYYICCTGTSHIPLAGETITAKGLYSGTYKVSSTISKTSAYILYPYIEASAITFNS